MKKLIYAADDDPNILEVLHAFLVSAEFEVRTFPTGDDLADAFSAHAPDLVVLDIMMPGTDGLTVCKRLRELSDVPIMILTAKESEMDYVTGLTLGGDDYLVKPFSPTLLVARVKALLRRAEMDSTAVGRTLLSFGDIMIANDEHAVKCRGKNIGLTMTELALMRCLLENPGKPVSRDTLLNQVWGMDANMETRVTDETVRRIRRKLKAANSSVLITAEWGYGYRLEDANEKRKG